MKNTLILLLMLMFALQSLLAAADVHHVLEPAAPMHSGHDHDHLSGQQDLHRHGATATPESVVDHHHPCCHVHAPSVLFLTPNHPPFAGDRASLQRFAAQHLQFSSWISAPDLRPPIV